MTQLPANMPTDGMSAYAYFKTVETPSIDDLKGMMFLEASGQGLYDGLVEMAESAEAKEILARNGREEQAHAHRLRRAIKILSDETVDVPEPKDNPYEGGLGFDALSREILEGLIAAEDDGKALYDGWADAVDNEEVAKLLRQNGKEEAGHAERVRQVLELMDA